MVRHRKRFLIFLLFFSLVSWRVEVEGDGVPTFVLASLETVFSSYLSAHPSAAEYAVDSLFVPVLKKKGFRVVSYFVENDVLNLKVEPVAPISNLKLQVIDLSHNKFNEEVVESWVRELPIESLWKGLPGAGDGWALRKARERTLNLLHTSVSPKLFWDLNYSLSGSTLVLTVYFSPLEERVDGGVDVHIRSDYMAPFFLRKLEREYEARLATETVNLLPEAVGIFFQEMKKEDGDVEWEVVSLENGTLRLEGELRDHGAGFFCVFGNFTTDRDFGSLVGGTFGVVGKRYLLLMEPTFALGNRKGKIDVFGGIRFGSLFLGGNYRRFEKRSKVFPAVRFYSRRWRGYSIFTKDVVEGRLAFLFSDNYALGANYYYIGGEERFYLSVEIYF